MSTEDPVWFAQQLVERLRREVAQKEAELSVLIAHKAVLLQAFSTPTFPAGYTASGRLIDAATVERCEQQADSNARPSSAPDDAAPSRRRRKGKKARETSSHENGNPAEENGVQPQISDDVFSSWTASGKQGRRSRKEKPPRETLSLANEEAPPVENDVDPHLSDDVFSPWTASGQQGKNRRKDKPRRETLLLANEEALPVENGVEPQISDVFSSWTASGKKGRNRRKDKPPRETLSPATEEDPPEENGGEPQISDDVFSSWTASGKQGRNRRKDKPRRKSSSPTDEAAEEIGQEQQTSELFSTPTAPRKKGRNCRKDKLPRETAPANDENPAEENGNEPETSKESFSTSGASGKRGKNRRKSCDPAATPQRESVQLAGPPASSGKKRQPSAAKFPEVVWTEQITATRSILNGDHSDSSDSSEDVPDKGRPVIVEPPSARKTVKKTLTSAAGPAKVATSLSCDAPPEDRFDWEVLDLSGPWSQDRSSSLAESSWSQFRPTSLPCTFTTLDDYRACFESLIFEECKASFHCAWDILQKTQVVGTDNKILETQALVNPGISEDRGQGNVWQFRPMYPSANDPFKYCEAEIIKGPILRLDPSEVVLVTYKDMKVLAIVTLTNFKSVLLRTRMELQACGGQCVLLRMANIVTLRRQYVALSRAEVFSDSLQQQLLDPRPDGNSGICPPSETCLDKTISSTSSINTIKAWKDRNIYNRKQITAVEAVLKSKQGFLLVQGPPGTGKTSTIVGMISAVHIHDPRARILLCASSNAAVDEIVSRLMHHMLDKDGTSFSPKRGTLVRVGVEKSILPACLPVTLDSLIVSNSMDPKSEKARREALAGASIVCCTISGSGHTIFSGDNLKFDLLIIDEAAQALECEVLIALQRVKSRCVMVGDPCQLPAVVLQRHASGYGRSLFERMQEVRYSVFLMTTQYRMHPQISQFPSAQFYGGRLEDSSNCHTKPPIFTEESREMGIDLSGYKFKLGAYCFLDVTSGVEQKELVGYSVLNVDEAGVVATVVQGIVRSLRNGIEPNIGVITPYLAQRSVIMDNLKECNLDERTCEVDTVDGFQGREKDVIVLSCVRAQAEHGLGFVSDVRRMNVALTRARHALIIVGHAQTLQRQSAAWTALIEDASARGFYQVLCQKPKTIMKVQDSDNQRASAAGTVFQPNGKMREGPGSSHKKSSGHLTTDINFNKQRDIERESDARYEHGGGWTRKPARFECGVTSVNGTVQCPNHIRFGPEDCIPNEGTGWLYANTGTLLTPNRGQSGAVDGGSLNERMDKLKEDSESTKQFHKRKWNWSSPEKKKKKPMPAGRQNMRGKLKGSVKRIREFHSSTFGTNPASDRTGQQKLSKYDHGQANEPCFGDYGNKSNVNYPRAMEVRELERSPFVKRENGGYYPRAMGIRDLERNQIPLVKRGNGRYVA